MFSIPAQRDLKSFFYISRSLLHYNTIILCDSFVILVASLSSNLPHCDLCSIWRPNPLGHILQDVLLNWVGLWLWRISPWRLKLKWSRLATLLSLGKVYCQFGCKKLLGNVWYEWTHSMTMFNPKLKGKAAATTLATKKEAERGGRLRWVVSYYVCTWMASHDHFTPRSISVPLGRRTLFSLAPPLTCTTGSKFLTSPFPSIAQHSMVSDSVML